jgi:hypothetical protein
MDRDAFRHLSAWNQNMESALEILAKLAEYPELQDEGFLIRRTYFEEQLTSVNLSVLQQLQESEQKVHAASFRERRSYEKRVLDPDDCYFEVLKREEERRQRGLPPMIGILRGMRRATSEEILSDILAQETEQEIQTDSESGLEDEADRDDLESGSQDGQHAEGH